jgi:hypothetical protein
MNPRPTQARRTALSSPQPGDATACRALTALALALALTACGGSSGGGGTSGGEGLGDDPDGLSFLYEPNAGGNASSLKIVAVRWGRLVDVLDETGDPEAPNSLVFQDFLIDHEITGSTLEYTLEANPVTGRENLVIRYPKESPEFLQVVQALEDAQPMLPKGVSASELPPFTAVARNSAVVFQFDDLVDEATVSQETIILEVGNPPSVPFESRIFPDPNHGDLVGEEYHSTRVVVDFTVSKIEAQNAPGLSVNTLGLPGAVVVSQANAAVRFPTVTGSGQFQLLTNLSGRALSFDDNGPTIPTSPNLDVVRAFRSQGATGITGDPNNGFLPDDIAPNVLTAQGVFVDVPDPADPSEVDITFTTDVCAMPSRTGDVLEFTGFVLQVVTPGQLVGTTVRSARVIALVGDLEKFGPSFGLFRTTWSPQLGTDAECFLRFNPLPGTAPNIDLPTQTSVLLSFSEPIDPASVQALDTFKVTYETPPVADPLFESVIGRISPEPDLQTFQFVPLVPLRHTAGTSETYFVDVEADDPDTIDITEGITDLAGNSLAFDLPQAAFTLSASEATQDTGGIGLRFVDSSFDENGDGLPELRGQQVHDPRELIKPRSFSRFSIAVDPSQPLVGAMIQFTQGVQTPLSSLGSRTMLLWRYIDMGFSLLDDQNHNLDVEGLHWSPFGTGVQQDFFTNFRVALAHSYYAPDEVTTTGLLPQYKESGIKPPFEGNLLDPIGDPLTVVAPKQNGYLISPSMVGLTTSGTPIVPWPINLDIPINEYRYWTWRDTGKLQLGSPTGNGVDPARLNQVLPGFGIEDFYHAAEVPTIGLPLLMEFRCYPDDTAFGLNGFATAIALNSSYKPTFRAFSTGGQSSNGTVIVDPDNEPVAKGGVNPNTGQQTLPIDNSFYYGQADFAVRVSRSTSRWFDTGAQHTFAPYVSEPAANTQPSGTGITVAWRGASTVSAAAGTPWEDAGNYDPYGDGFDSGQLQKLGLPVGNEFTVTYHPTSGDNSWKNDLTLVNGARFVQFRVTFLANAESGLIPELSALGFAFSK